jgi:ABC-type transporter Mla subunit MlaD
VQDTAGRFTCALETSRDLAHACERRLEDLQVDLIYYALARDIWRDQAPRTASLAAILSDFVAEVERHQRALEDLAQRLAPLAADEDFHVHLDPPDSYRDLYSPLRKRKARQPSKYSSIY